MRPVVALLLALSVASGPATAAERSIPASAEVYFVGAGAGHGHGLSQYGAEGAARRGLSYRQIVRFYYPHTQWGTASGSVTVLITGDTTPDVVVLAEPGLTVRSVATGKVLDLTRARPHATRWRILPRPGRTSEIGYRVAANTAWQRLGTVAGEVEFAAGAHPVTLVTPTGRVAYRGALRSAVAAGGGRDTVNVVGLDAYLEGVVPREVPALWHKAAVQAQAVAARTYAAYERLHPLAPDYQICDTSQCQVYGGADAENPASNAAVEATRGQVLTAGGKPAFTQFSASNGGYTSPGGFPYLPARKDPYDGWSGNPYNHWTSRRFSVATIEHVFPEVGRLRSIELLDRDGRGRYGGRVGSVTITGDAGSTTVSGDTFRSYFALDSTLFTMHLS